MSLVYYLRKSVEPGLNTCVFATIKVLRLIHPFFSKAELEDYRRIRLEIEIDGEDYEFPDFNRNSDFRSSSLTLSSLHN